jgi:hypothetical protein
MTWRPLLEGNVTLASFFNPGIQPLACDLLNHCLVGHPWEIRGSLAYILSRDTATYVVENWESEGGAHDIRIPRLARRMKKPLLVHCPSLVYHVGYQSTWDENFHQAIDFDRTWRRPREAPLL